MVESIGHVDRHPFFNPVKNFHKVAKIDGEAGITAEELQKAEDALKEAGKNKTPRIDHLQEKFSNIDANGDEVLSGKEVWGYVKNQRNEIINTQLLPESDIDIKV